MLSERAPFFLAAGASCRAGVSKRNRKAEEKHEDAKRREEGPSFSPCVLAFSSSLRFFRERWRVAKPLALRVAEDELRQLVGELAVDQVLGALDHRRVGDCFDRAHEDERRDLEVLRAQLVAP